MSKICLYVYMCVSSHNNAYCQSQNDTIIYQKIKIKKKSNIYPFANEQNIYLYRKCWFKGLFQKWKNNQFLNVNFITKSIQIITTDLM